MSATCPSCQYENPVGTQFCEVCGSEIGLPPVEVSFPSTSVPQVPQSYSDPLTEIQPPIPQPTQSPYSNTASPHVTTSTISANTARLIPKQVSSSVSEFSLDSSAIVGRFDPDSGPVEVDLEGFSGDETVSRNHAEIYHEAGEWKVKDLGSTNGVFIKRSGQTRFGARITMPENLNYGDEIAFGKIRFLFLSP